MKKFTFWGYLRLCLWLYFGLLTSCKLFLPVENSNTGVHRWSVEAKILPGYRTESFPLINGWDVPAPIFVTNNNMLISDNGVIAVIYHTNSYEMAQRVRQQLLATGLVETIKISD
jgi:hypothetical protein